MREAHNDEDCCLDNTDNTHVNSSSQNLLNAPSKYVLHTQAHLRCMSFVNTLKVVQNSCLMITGEVKLKKNIPILFSLLLLLSHNHENRKPVDSFVAQV